jgi:hypothetical protein
MAGLNLLIASGVLLLLICALIPLSLKHDCPNVPALPGDWLDESVRAFCTAQGQAHRIGTAEKYQGEGM